MGSLQNACQAVLHPLESIQLLSGPQQDPCEAPLAEGAAHKAAEEEDDEEPGRLHQVWYCDQDPYVVDVRSKASIPPCKLFCIPIETLDYRPHMHPLHPCPNVIPG